MDADPLPVDLGKRLRAAREYAGYSNASDFAERLGWKPSNWGRVERGERTLKQWEADGLLPSVARLCEVPADWFTAPWGSPLSAPVPLADDEPEWVGRIEDQLKLIQEVLRGAYPEAAAQEEAVKAAEDAARRRASQQSPAAPDTEHKPGKGQAT